MNIRQVVNLVSDGVIYLMGLDCSPVLSEKISIYFETIRGTSLDVVRSRQEMRVTTWSGIATGKTPRQQ